MSENVGFNLARVHEAIAARFPERECIVFRDRRLTWHDVTDRSRRLANLLISEGFGARTTGRDGLAGHESHQDHLAIYCYNGNEYLEAMLGACKARTASINVNYRYVAEELRYLLADSQAKAIVYHGEFAPTLAEVLPELPQLRVLLQVDDGSENPLLPGARWYEAAIAGHSGDLPVVADAWSPDDLYVLYTGGTTGMPKGVLWRQHDIFMGVLGRNASGQPPRSIDDVLAVAASGGQRLCAAPPFMHAAGHWMAFLAMFGGGTVVIQDEVRHFDAAGVLRLVDREQVRTLMIVGDAFARPLLDELDRGTYDLSSLMMLVSGGAPLTPGLKQRFLDRLPNLVIMDTMGSSEGGSQLAHVTTADQRPSTGTFSPSDGTCIVSDDFAHILPTGNDEEGWVAKQGHVPLGYLGDAGKSARTFVVVDGVRCSIPGDRGRQLPNGTIELLGRASVTINSGGEKIFVEEVEGALASHPDVYDVVVAGRPEERWGNEVVAIVRLREGVQRSTDVEHSLLAEAARHIARYKLPKAIVFVDDVVRSPAGKADYRWAQQIAVAGRDMSTSAGG